MSSSVANSEEEQDPYPAVTSASLRLSYRIGRGEQGVLTFEPYKSRILPLWRFRTPAIARESADALWRKFLEYDTAGDFVGMDMTRKFIQMGMTRAQRYANHKGGRKYEKLPASAKAGRGKELQKSAGHKGKEEKEKAANIFREVWGWCREHEGYQRKKEAFQKEIKEDEKRKKNAEH